ncbi:MAG: UDP-N-acetylmuramoyl-tripeptide--D-alanyl-D-alanine ligase [Tepidisphaeraceae bacterium]|jgi:UDP-N-acetylmuramoyl-tripeptide--D-alanyl-D-alanine ligase
MDAISLQQVCEFVDGRVLGESPQRPPAITGIVRGSDDVRPGCLFVALRGEKHDGHGFLRAAAANGAVAALVDHVPPECPADLVLIQVADTRKAMGHLAHGIRMAMKSTVIGVGGSNGKTGTKHIIDSVLCHELRGTFSPKSFNNDIGVPLAIFAADPRHDYLVLELGTNHPGEIRTLTHLARPDIAVITNCSEEHLEGLGDIDGVRKEESSIIEGLNPAGLLVVNGDDPRVLEAVAAYPGRRVTFGTQQTNDLYSTNIHCDFDGVEFLLNGETSVYLPLLGKHTAINSLAAIAVARHFGLSDEEIVEALAIAHGPEMRLQLLRLGGVTIVNDAYNANPASMQAAIETLAALPCHGRRIAILGDMRELGDKSDEAHRRMGVFVVASSLDLLICVGEKAALIAAASRDGGFAPEWILKYPDAPAAAAAISSIISPGDLVLVKGSNVMKLGQIADAMQAQPARRSA